MAERVNRVEVLVEVCCTFLLPFTAEELAISAWLHDPQLWGMKGFEEQHPCTHKVMYRLCGERGLVNHGYLERLKDGRYVTLAKCYEPYRCGGGKTTTNLSTKARSEALQEVTDEKERQRELQVRQLLDARNGMTRNKTKEVDDDATTVLRA